MHAVEQIDAATLFIILVGVLIFLWVMRLVFRKKR